MQHGKLVVVCSDPAQITKISQTTKENAFSTFFVCVPGLPTRTHTRARSVAVVPPAVIEAQMSEGTGSWGIISGACNMQRTQRCMKWPQAGV
jgi:hypothetical protein